MLALFVLRGLSMQELLSLRVMLDGEHPTRAALRRVGFIARAVQKWCSRFTRASLPRSELGWRLTQGDKDI